MTLRGVQTPRCLGNWCGRKAGKQRLYGLDARGLRRFRSGPAGSERFWNESFDGWTSTCRTQAGNRRGS